MRAEAGRRRWTHQELADALTENGTVIARSALSERLKRGAFTFAFFLQCLAVMRYQKFEIAVKRDLTNEPSSVPPGSEQSPRRVTPRSGDKAL
jgi:hypothetical protein